MKIQFRGIGRRILDVLGMDRMGEKYPMFSLLYLFLMLYTTLETVFVNTLLYRISGGEMSTVFIYRGINYTATAVAMHLSAYVSQKKTPIITLRIGSCFFFILYVLLFAGQDNILQIRHLLAALSGIGNAFYYGGHNLLVQSYTNKRNRDVGISILGIIQGVMTLFIPIVSGFVISLMPGEISGYRVMFGIGMLTVAMQFYFSFRLEPTVQTKHKSEIRLAIKLLIKKTSYKLMMVYEFFRGVRDGTFAFVLNMLLFEIITQESLVGINTFLTGVMAILGSWVYGRLVKSTLRSRYSLIATTVLLIMGSLLFIKMNAPMVMLFSIVNAFAQLFIVYSCNNTTYDVISQNETARKCSAEMFAIREAPITLGRLLGITIMMNSPQTQTGSICSLCILTATQYLVAAVIRIVSNQLYRKELRAVSTQHSSV